MKKISPCLIRAYREAKYVVEHISPITLHVGQSSLRLSSLLKEHQVNTAAFITAYNPYSNVLSEQENISAHNSLIKDINALGLQTFHGFGQDLNEQWPKERSVLILRHQ
jgi:hypothetical protein